MRRIKLSGGGYTVVDNEDYEYLNEYSWCESQGYAYSSTKGMMHRWIMKAPTGKDVDHINGNRRDNRKKNLRLCSRSENLHNSKVHKDNKSGYKGVYFAAGKYRADIMCKGKRTHIGTYYTSEEAAKAYDKIARQQHKKFAKTNF